MGGGSNGTPNAARGPITTSNRSFTAPLQQLQQAGCLPPPPAAAASASVVSGMPSGMPYLFCSGNPPQGTYVYYPYIPASSSQLSSGPTASAVGGAASKRHHTFALGSVPGGGNRFDALAGSGCVPSAASPKLSHQVTPRGLPEGASYVGAGEGVTRDFGTIGPEEKGRRWAKQSVGPAGANLFVYYLPGSLSDADLATAFAPFGEVLSAKVYYDRDTGESKGFGENLRVCVRVCVCARFGTFSGLPIWCACSWCHVTPTYYHITTYVSVSRRTMICFFFSFFFFCPSPSNSHHRKRQRASPNVRATYRFFLNSRDPQRHRAPWVYQSQHTPPLALSTNTTYGKQLLSCCCSTKTGQTRPCRKRFEIAIQVLVNN